MRSARHLIFLALRALLVLTLFTASTISSSQASKSPKHIFGLYGERVPLCFNGQFENGKFKYDCEGEVANTLLVLPTATTSDGGAWVDINLHFHSGHGCSIQGHGKWVGDHLKVEPRLDADTCELQIHFKKGKAILSEDGRCRSMSCGSRGGYNGISLLKRGSI